MKALIDSDYFAYAHGAATDDEGKPLSWPLVASRISQQITNIVDQSGADEYELYLTGEGNFRESVAIIKPYKGNRPTDKPFHYQRIRDYLLKFRNAHLSEGLEADDTVCIEHLKDPKNTIICHIDKDIDMCPGLHYNWIKDKKYYVRELDGLRCFYSQLLTGDPTDNIPGLFGVGVASAHVKHLVDYTDELGMYTLVRKQYELRFGSYWKMFLEENASLLWMLREETNGAYHPETEVIERLRCLEEQR